ncbi:MAG: isoprenylcysteine carboxylmethyltransferase family protein [Trueperaceae bacterium]|nr:MAG: isoprenylcysteine carboxylmethyltransferase family protein [Trueperaceae bacterium]
MTDERCVHGYPAGVMGPLARTLVFTVIVPGTVAGLIPWGLLALEPSGWRLDAALLGWLGAVPITFGVGLYAWCGWGFATAGRGTPSPHDPPRELVTTGPYARSRNPMYAAVVAVVLGLATVYGSAALLVYGLVLAASFHRRVVRFEEPVLARDFGDAYASYRERVPRWW